MDLPESCQKFIDESEWIYSKSMPWSPHAYVVRSEENEEAFVEFAQFIRDNGFKAHYVGLKMKFTYLEHQGYRYWTMGNPMPKTIILNRCSVDLYDRFETETGIWFDSKLPETWEKKKK